MVVNKVQKRAFRIVLWLSIILLSGCVSSAPRTVKIGMVAPFEGRYREIGEDILPAARLALREWASDPNSSQLAIELVAYDDMGDPMQARKQASKLVEDPDVAIVIGHWRDETTRAGSSVYQEASMPLIVFSSSEIRLNQNVWNMAPTEHQLLTKLERWAAEEGMVTVSLLNEQESLQQDVRQAQSAQAGASGTDTKIVGGWSWGLREFSSLLSISEREDFPSYIYITGFALPSDVRHVNVTQDQMQQFIAEYTTGSLGKAPGQFAWSAYQATWLAISQIADEDDISVSHYSINDLQFSDAFRKNPPVYLYRWHQGERILVDSLGT